jgi:S-adenosylmethionine/arginine decarboxylase-like enzyme
MQAEHAENPSISEVMKTASAYAANQYLGRHIIAEFFQADLDALNKADELC